jgi:protein SCO1/2
MNDTTHHNSPASSQPEPGSILPHVIAIAILIVATYGAFKWWQVRTFEASRGEAIALTQVGPPLTEFELTERSGKPFRTADMKGRVWVATYFFATCPGNCIRLNQNIQFMHNLPELKDTTWVSITWLFCRADLDYTKRVARGMNVALERKGHQDHAIVIDKTGKIRGWYDATSKSQCERLHAKLLECMAEEPPRDLAATKDDPEAGKAEKNAS